MKRQVFSYLFALLFSILPLETVVGATGTEKKISIGGTDYTDSGTCLNNACVDFDDDSATITLNNYNGGSILVEGYDTVDIVLRNSSYITTSGEYGIKTDAKNLNFPFRNSYGSLGIAIDSSTDRANGIWLTDGSLTVDKWQSFNMNIRANVPESTVTADKVTGITTPLNREVIVSAASCIYIWNYNGNYGIYTGKYTADAQEVDGQYVGFNMFGVIRHKITDGVGDAFYYNDFEGAEIPADPKVDAPREVVTFTHNKWSTSGEFKFTPIFSGVSANFDTELTSGEDIQSANERIRGSIVKEEDYSFLSQFDRYDPFPFEINTSNARLVVADDFEDGTYHEIDDSETSSVQPDEKYALYIPFYLWETEWSAFSKVKGQNYALLNREETNDVFFINSGRAYVLAPLNLDGQMTDYVAPVSLTLMAAVQNSEEEPAQPQTASTLPKAPNTGVAK
ncbi:MAG: hypothetical protein J6Y87_01025 [Muribaculaceae bacterium]|nr:hypothetical protein [Muribaculaceae bacterium]